MKYINHYRSPLGNILLAADDEGLTGLWFEQQKYFGKSLNAEPLEQEIPVFEETKKWLDTYFSGKEPDFIPPLHMIGTDFQLEVWRIFGCKYFIIFSES